VKYAVLLAVAAIAAIAVATTGSAQLPPGPHTLTFKEFDKGSKFTFVDAAKPKADRKHPPSQGDYFAFVTPLTDQGKIVAELDAKCTVMKAARNGHPGEIDLCEGVVNLADGSLTLQTRVISGKPIDGAVTGGTGNYANARGTFHDTGDEANATITLTFSTS
jgi:hypothetical protein